jgi:hypothetical protein
MIAFHQITLLDSQNSFRLESTNLEIGLGRQ